MRFRRWRLSTCYHSLSLSFSLILSPPSLVVPLFGVGARELQRNPREIALSLIREIKVPRKKNKKKKKRKEREEKAGETLAASYFWRTRASCHFYSLIGVSTFPEFYCAWCPVVRCAAVFLRRRARTGGFRYTVVAAAFVVTRHSRDK